MRQGKVAQVKPETLDDRRVLKLADRCDRCGAQAFARATIRHDVAGASTLTEFMFCGHHFAEHEATLYLVAVRVVDERAHINLKPSDYNEKGLAR